MLIYCIVAIIAAGVDGGRSISPEFKKAEARFDKKCSGLDNDLVNELRATISLSPASTRAKLNRVARDWAREQGVFSEFQHCISAVTTLVMTEKYLPPPPPPKLQLDDLDPVTKAYLQASESCRWNNSKGKLDRLGNARLKAAILAKAIIDKSYRESNYRFAWQIRTPTKFKNKKSRTKARNIAAQELASAETAYDISDHQFCQPRLTLTLNAVGHLFRTQVSQVLSPTEMHLTLDDESYVLRGVSTEGYTDGAWATFFETFAITDTVTYATIIGGSKTVFVVVPAEIDNVAVTRWKRERKLH